MSPQGSCLDPGGPLLTRTLFGFSVPRATVLFRDGPLSARRAATSAPGFIETPMFAGMPPEEIEEVVRGPDASR
jgi:hypothetical protein